MQHYGCLKVCGLLSAGFCPNICAGWDGLVPGDWEKDFGELISNSQDFSYLAAHGEGDGRVGQMVGVGGDPAWDQVDQGGPSPKHNLWGKLKIPRTFQECYLQLMGVHMPQVPKARDRWFSTRCSSLKWIANPCVHLLNLLRPTNISVTLFHIVVSDSTELGSTAWLLIFNLLLLLLPIFVLCGLTRGPASTDMGCFFSGKRWRSA